MSQVTLSTLERHLPELVYQAEKGEDVHITRHGKAVAVIVSQKRYNHAFRSDKGVFSAFLKWRERYPDGSGFTNQELVVMRSRDAYP